MKICLISREYPKETGFGGIGSYNYYLSRGLIELGHSVTILCSFLEYPKFYEEEGIVIKRIGPYSDIASYRQSIKNFFERLGPSKFDIVESPDWSADGAYLNRQILGGTPHVVTCHTPSWLLYKLFREARTRWEETKNVLRPWRWPGIVYSEEIKTVRNADAVHSPSKAMLDIVEDRVGFLANKQIIPNPCPSDSKTETSARRFIPKTPIILFVGKLNVHKGADYLASIIPLIVRKIKYARFRLVGADARSPAKFKATSMKQFLQQRLGFLNDRVQFLGHLPLNRVREEYRLADVLIVPSRWECFGIVIAEAMASGCPVVGSCNGGIAELIASPKYGITADPRDAESFSEAVASLVNDKNMRQRIVTDSREMVRRELSPKHVASLKVDAYRSAIGGESDRK